MTGGPLTLRRFTGHDPELPRFIPDLARLRIRVFRDFPYLYDGTMEYEAKYLRTYTNSAGSLVVLALDGEAVVGATTGIPLKDDFDEIRRPFVAAGYDPAAIYYCGESIMLPEYRGRGIYRRFFEAREGHARDLGRFDLVTFCCVERPPDHPLRPAGYVPLDDTWARYGYQRRPELRTTLHWKDVDSGAETGKPLVFWLKRLEGRTR